MVNNQRGGIVSFVVVGVVLAGLLAGALYLSKQQGREARNDTPAPQIAEQNTDKQKAPTEKSDVKSTDQQTSNTTDNSSNSSSTGNRTSDESQAPRSTDRVANTGPSENIPSTGPVETVATVTALAGLTFALYRHAASRRGVRFSSLRK